MRSSVVAIALAALATSACEHPVTSARLHGPPPGQSVSLIVTAPGDEREQAVLARRTLQTLLRDRAAAPAGRVTLPRVPGSAAAGPLANPSWLEAQSSVLRALADRSRAAALAVRADEQK